MADAVYESMLFTTCEVWRPTKTTGSNLSQSISYVQDSSSVSCRIAPKKATLAEYAAGYTPDYDHKGYFKSTEDIQDNDAIYVQSGSYAGTYVVTGVHIPAEATAIHHISAFLKRREIGGFSWAADFSNPANSALEMMDV